MLVVVSIWLTSGSIFRLITPSPRTVGVKARPTPNFLNSTVVLPSVEEIGMGNSPPARKLAVSPDSAVRFGSARRRITPRSSSACKRPSALTPLPSSRPTIVPNGADPETRSAAPTATPTPVPPDASAFPKTRQLTPSSRLAEREASTKRTSSITCCGAATLTALITSAPNCLATVIAWSTIMALGALPASMMRPFTEETRKRACGNRCESSLPSREVS